MEKAPWAQDTLSLHHLPQRRGSGGQFSHLGVRSLGECWSSEFHSLPTSPVSGREGKALREEYPKLALKAGTRSDCSKK